MSDGTQARAEGVEFRHAFRDLTGPVPCPDEYGPFPWQEHLYERMLHGDVPRACDIPTGLGKTSVIAIWLLALAHHASAGTLRDFPRRLVYVVNRRTVVDQATREAEHMREALCTRPELEAVARVLRSLAVRPSDGPLAISTLRGQFADNAEWRNDPARPAVIVGTVDMVGSRLLFAGYGRGFKSRPLHAGFLGQDVLLVHDEAHLEPPFQDLLTAIQKEQERRKEFGKFRVMEMSATSRSGGEVFGLTRNEKCPPDKIPDPPEQPIHVAWRRQKAKKVVHLHTNEDEKNPADEIADRALRFKDSGRALLVFVRKVEDVEKVVKKLPKGQTQQLTGTLRGLERDRMADPRKETGCPIFARFLRPPRPGTSQNERWKIEPRPGTVYLVCTSAGEVGVNISADHLVCDLSAFDSMVQRFGRVNRFGDRDDTEIHIVHPAKFEEKNELDQRRKKTLELINQLNRDASPKALGELKLEDRFAAFAPPPTILPTSDILFDSWALTTIRDKLPGRPPVEPYLHGLSEWEPPETHVAWRDEVGVITGKLLEEYKPKDLLEDYPLKPHELLRDTSGRIFERLQKLNAPADTPVWVVSDDDSVKLTSLDELVRSEKESLNYKTVLLPPTAGGLQNGMFAAGAVDANDVADEWRDESSNRRRVRVWDDDPQFDEKTKGMRLIRTIDTDPDADEGEEESGTTGRRYWHWYELPKSADNDGSKAGQKRVEWQVHTNDVVRNTTQIVQRLQLSEELRNAVILAAKFHDLGKRRPLFQRILGNMDTDILLAKSGKKKQPFSLGENYRHEFGSLLDVPNEPEFQKLSDDNMKELVLHLIAAHHGRGRPHFPTEEAFDPEPKGQDVSLIAAAVPQRFARLQRRYGRWGLAYLESLLRAADYDASAKPSAVVEDDQ